MLVFAVQSLRRLVRDIDHLLEMSAPSGRYSLFVRLAQLAAGEDAVQRKEKLDERVAENGVFTD